jgi:hypothetical protein
MDATTTQMSKMAATTTKRKNDTGMDGKAKERRHKKLKGSTPKVLHQKDPPAAEKVTKQMHQQERHFSVTTGRPITATLAATVEPVADTVPAPVPEVVVGHQSKRWFEACQRNGRMDNEAMLAKDISAYVRYELFPKLKFIMSKKQLYYTAERPSICGLICDDMGLMDQTTAVAWWERYKDMIADVLNAKRADVTGAVKRAFLRKSTGHDGLYF